MLHEFINGYIDAMQFCALDDEQYRHELESAGTEVTRYSPGAGEFQGIDGFSLTDAEYESVRRECTDFYESIPPPVWDRMVRDVYDGDFESAGMDFYFTRNHHGTGYWDKGGRTDWGPFLIVLSEWAQSWGSGHTLQVAGYVGPDDDRELIYMIGEM